MMVTSSSPEASALEGSLTLVRVRMPRRAFATLGVPIVNPEAEGLVDVEVVVAEDGIARSIRRVALVGPQ